MKTDHAGRFLMSGLKAPALFWTAALLFGGLWFLVAPASALYAVPATLVVPIVAAGWRQSRARTARWKAALDPHAEREMARAEEARARSARHPASAAVVHEPWG